jgi:DNA processing protein
VVVEGGEKSGSSITARCALEQNRSVMAVPGSIYSYYSKRPHSLIKDGAVLVENVKDIIQEISFQGNEPTDESDQTMSLLSTLMSPDEFKLYEKLGAYPMHIDDLVQMTGLPVSTVSGALLQMELKELIQSLPGQMYQRK